MNRLLSVILPVLFIVACSVQERIFTFSEITDVKQEEVTRVEIRAGSTGELRTVFHQEDIETLFDLLKTLEYIRESPQKQFSGYSYYADLYSANQKLLRVTFAGDRVQFDNTIYFIEQQIQDFLDELFGLGL
jgi:hypothetical protein